MCSTKSSWSQSSLQTVRGEAIKPIKQDKPRLLITNLNIVGIQFCDTMQDPIHLASKQGKRLTSPMWLCQLSVNHT
jgi:hypothetical protein